MFLPIQSIFFLLLSLLLAACGDTSSATADVVAGPHDNESLPRVTVVAGSGEVAADWVQRTRDAVTQELPLLVEVFDGKPKHPFFVHVHADRESMPAALSPLLHEDSPAFALLGQHQIHLVWGEVRRLGISLRGVVRHELVHELLDQYVAPHGKHMPRWFHEGLAQHLAGDSYLRAREDDLALSLVVGRLPSFRELQERFPSELERLRSAYAQSLSYVSWLVRRYGLAEMLAVARAVDDITAFDPALAGRTGRSTYDLAEAWRNYVLHGSGAPWRVFLDQCFTLSLLAVLPILVLALRRHLTKEARAGRALAEAERRMALQAAAAAEASDAARNAANGELAMTGDSLSGDPAVADPSEATPDTPSMPSTPSTPDVDPEAPPAPLR